MSMAFIGPNYSGQIAHWIVTIHPDHVLEQKLVAGDDG
jgi:hypothetical protein